MEVTMSDFGYLILGFFIGILIYKIQGGNNEQQ
jgi:hypothetical protein